MGTQKKNISFSPGPSRVSDNISRYVSDAARLGVMSMNHRSKEFVQLSKQTVDELKTKLSIPKNYTIFFVSSATECWEIIAQSLITEKSYHFYSGEFGKKWYEHTSIITGSANGLFFDPEEHLNPDQLTSLARNNDVICITQNETSNGTQVTDVILQKTRKNYPDTFIAIDATSSMAGIKLDFRLADVWFASIQKCFGLPAGLAVMVCSQRAINRIVQIGEKRHYNSLFFINEIMKKWQTTHTPNVLGIYLLMRTMSDRKPIAQIHTQTLKRFNEWVLFINNIQSIKLFINNTQTRSYTVLVLEASSKTINTIKLKATKQGFLLGDGYGDLKKTTFRIANFPELTEREIKKLKYFLKSID